MTNRQLNFEFWDNFILRCADTLLDREHKGGSVINIRDMCNNGFPELSENVIVGIPRKLQEDGYGKDISTKEGLSFYFNNVKIFESADNIRKRRMPRTIKENVRVIKLRDWISICALIVALVALFK